ncbi:hypothetical protein SOV_50280 [Sporomusa ovata DSM 2662]|uniref:DUF4870 domain-containing protein n=2 Tax=Sporomusa ovata TaxID=2378 RepID=A0A0U1L2U6_9FIRM|nr:DUF4870 domain-containing protein [Sporomusa ovata]EQB27401.1 Tic20-like protein [Sporomusa ovata DSM 2662]CQR73244.1 hypothetical protein SpAn4DRAFT_2476 [Sporomusa ovata]
MLAAAAHCGCFFGGLGFGLLPLVIWLCKSKDIFVAHHAKQAAVFQLALVPVILLLVLALSPLIETETAAWIIVIGAGLLWMGCAILATVRALSREYYVYPVLVPFGVKKPK